MVVRIAIVVILMIAQPLVVTTLIIIDEYMNRGPNPSEASVKKSRALEARVESALQRLLPPACMD